MKLFYKEIKDEDGNFLEYKIMGQSDFEGAMEFPSIDIPDEYHSLENLGLELIDEVVTFKIIKG